MKRHLTMTSAIATALFLAAAHAQQTLPSSPADPFLWLEEVEGAKAMEWVNAKNAATLGELTKSPLYAPMFDRTRKILDSKDRIAYPSILKDRIYNFWQDAEHERGIWRRTTLAEYLSGNPRWETVLDIDALAREEKTPWAFGGADCLEPEARRCLINLSRGGSDAVEVREFDLQAKQWIAGGFRIPEAKTATAWIDESTVLVGTDFGPGSMTTSGYPGVTKLWKRGTPLSAAQTVLEIPSTDMGLFPFGYDAGGRRYIRLSHQKNFYESVQYLYEAGKAVKIDVQPDADINLLRNQVLVFVRTPWEVGGRTWKTGSLIAMPVDDFLRGERTFKLVTEPGPRESINGMSVTKDYVLVNVLNNVNGELRRYRFDNGDWKFEKVKAPDKGTVGVSATSPYSNSYFFTYTNFIQPTTLYYADESGSIKEVKRLPVMWDSSGVRVDQLEATSKDGTKIPFFLVRREGQRTDGTNPTLLGAYGGFEVANTPAYSTTLGAAWLERGGTYVLANIRGGGEFGPSWHRAGLKENRQRIYDDFIAVAEELIARKITSPRHLGIIGGSNGGLLMGVALTQRPDLFNAIVIQVPLLDMQRYSKLLAGASWMAEYGDPDKPEEWAFMSKYSPYQNLKPNMKYPKVLFTTTTRDDRVHPGHARKMAARMESMGYPFYYFENTEGGHGTGVTSEQRAKTIALTYVYLWQQLKPGS
jgi:prolyl oligopeptidase